MNYVIDIIVLLCLGWGAYKGFKKGFIIQSFTILALVIAIWGGFAFAKYLEPFMKTQLGMGELAAAIVSFIFVFVLALILVYTSGRLVTKVVSVAGLGMINRLSGAAFGILANVLILSIIFSLFGRVNDKKQKPFIEKATLSESILYEPVKNAAQLIVPDAIKDIFD